MNSASIQRFGSLFIPERETQIGALFMITIALAVTAATVSVLAILSASNVNIAHFNALSELGTIGGGICAFAAICLFSVAMDLISSERRQKVTVATQTKISRTRMQRKCSYYRSTLEKKYGPLFRPEKTILPVCNSGTHLSAVLWGILKTMYPEAKILFPQAVFLVGTATPTFKKGYAQAFGFDPPQALRFPLSGICGNSVIIPLTLPSKESVDSWTRDLPYPVTIWRDLHFDDFFSINCTPEQTTEDIIDLTEKFLDNFIKRFDTLHSL